MPISSDTEVVGDRLAAWVSEEQPRNLKLFVRHLTPEGKD